MWGCLHDSRLNAELHCCHRSPPSPIHESTVRALVVDDDRTLTLLVRRLLEEEGFAVDVADLLEDGRTLAMVNDYDAIVLDLVLPDGNGIPLIQSLRRDGKATPLIVLTGTADSAMTVRALDAGADDY